MDFQTFPTLVLWHTDPKLFPRDPHLVGCSRFRGTPAPFCAVGCSKGDRMDFLGPCSRCGTLRHPPISSHIVTFLQEAHMSGPHVGWRD